MSDLEQLILLAAYSYLFGLIIVGTAETRFGRWMLAVWYAYRDSIEAGLALLGRLVRRAAGKARSLVRSRPSTPPAPADTVPAGSVPLLVEGRAQLSKNDTRGLFVSAQRWGKTAAAEGWLASQLGDANPTNPTNQA